MASAMCGVCGEEAGKYRWVGLPVCPDCYDRMLRGDISLAIEDNEAVEGTIGNSKEV